MENCNSHPPTGRKCGSGKRAADRRFRVGGSVALARRRTANAALSPDGPKQLVEWRAAPTGPESVWGRDRPARSVRVQSTRRRGHQGFSGGTTGRWPADGPHGVVREFSDVHGRMTWRTRLRPRSLGLTLNGSGTGRRFPGRAEDRRRFSRAGERLRFLGRGRRKKLCGARYARHPRTLSKTPRSARDGAWPGWLRCGRGPGRAGGTCSTRETGLPVGPYRRVAVARRGLEPDGPRSAHPPSPPERKRRSRWGRKRTASYCGDVIGPGAAEPGASSPIRWARYLGLSAPDGKIAVTLPGRSSAMGCGENGQSHLTSRTRRAEGVHTPGNVGRGLAWVRRDGPRG